MSNPAESVLRDPFRVILGLCLLDSGLRKQLEKTGSFEQLMSRMDGPIDAILSEQGRKLFYGSASNTISSDSVPNLTDEPLQKLEEDLLGRAAFARYLARRLESTEFHSGAYSIHLYGPWGSGKSTLLNFLKQELLTSERPNNGSAKTTWLVAEFNAWRNQHINPPWWPLYAQMYDIMKKSFSFGKRLKEWYWRLSVGQWIYILLFIILLWLLVIVFNSLKASNPNETWATLADKISKLIALISTVAGGFIAFTRSFHLGSAKAAKSFEEFGQDPMNAIRKRFKKHLDWLPANTRLMVTIDDLDRCTSDYVVSLLEGIQTLYRQGNIVFIVAADKRWINACFEEKYTKLSNLIMEPGKPLGTLFLEKTFQLCAPVPGMPKELKDDFWKQLISLKAENILDEMEKVRSNAKNTLDAISEESAIIDKVNEFSKRPIHEQIAMRAEAVVHLATPGVMERTEHTLKQFAPLLDDNPRAMKRFVNAYSVNRALSTLSFSDIEVNDLAQWTIISMRWPSLAEELTSNPGLLDSISSSDWPALGPKLTELLKKNSDIHKIILDTENIGFGKLTEETVRQCENLM